MTRRILKACTAWVAAAALMQPVLASAAVVSTGGGSPPPSSGTLPLVTAQPAPNADVAPFFHDPASDPQLTDKQIINLLRHRVKYVFVLFQENRSFDHYFGSFRGANGLFSDGVNPRSPANTPGFSQPIYDRTGALTTITPFRIGTAQNASDLDDIDHGHPRMAAKMHLDASHNPQMDRFAIEEQAKYLSGGPIITGAIPSTPPAPVTSRSVQYGQLAMAYVDCDTIPFMWNYANKFTLFDNIFQTTVGPSTPNAIAMIAGQSGETQWVKHGSGNTVTNTAWNGSTTVPVTNDPLPGLPGASNEWSGVPSAPTNTVATNNTQPPPAPQRKNEFGGATNVAPNLTFASLALTLAGRTLNSVSSSDANPGADLMDVQNDIPAIVAGNTPAYGWGWYQNGYDTEANLPTANGINTVPHASYVGHHNGPQYFGYVQNNPQQSSHLHGLNDFFGDISAQALPKQGGVFYVRGGYDNVQGLSPDTSHASSTADANYIAANFLGDDDHPAYSDSQISEALLAREINAIASSPYWSQSAIVITYDESEGDYDHVPPRILSYDPVGNPLSRGPRIPLLVISPYARVHVVSHEEGDHNSVIGLVNSVFGLPPLAGLPDELAARTAGQAASFNTAGVTQTNLGPHDDLTPGTGKLLSAFDPGRLLGTSAPLPASYAMIPTSVVNTLPHYGGAGCSALGLTTEDTVQGITTTIPAQFSPRPSQSFNN
jgi:phospholipase C